MILHSDAGSQYTAIRYTENIALEGILASIGSVGDAYDNAAAETVMGLFTTEAVRSDSPFRTRPLEDIHDVENIVLDYVPWYNHDRLRGALNNLTPVEYETAYYTSQREPTNR